MSVTAPDWIQVTVDNPEVLGDAAWWVNSDTPLWCARIDPAFTPGQCWYLLTHKGDHDYSLRLPFSYVKRAGLTPIPAEDQHEPPASLAGDLTHLYTKACQHVYDHLLAKYGTEA